MGSRQVNRSYRTYTIAKKATKGSIDDTSPLRDNSRLVPNDWEQYEKGAGFETAPAPAVLPSRFFSDPYRVYAARQPSPLGR